DPKIYARITTFLGTLANGMYDELIKRGIKVKRLPFALLQGAAQPALQNGLPFQSRDPIAYDTFDHWLKDVEEVLEKEDRSLLLAFDESEKLDEADERGDLNLPLFLDWCRQVIQYRPHIILLFSGVHTFGSMGEKTGLNWSNYFVNVQTLKVSFL